jgi:type I restriction enzyme R subunit
MKYQNKLMRIAQILLTKASIPEIFAKKDILKEIADEKYYDSLDFFKLDNVKKEVAPLMKYLSGDEVFITITNFNDAIETKEREIKYNFDDFRTYREKFIIYLHKHFGELESVKKILNLEQLNEDDLSELQDVLNELKKPDDESLFNNNEELIVFIRQIIGLDRKLVDKKCASFINENDFSKEQRQLINMIIDFAIRNGNITNDDLVNTEPFCDQDISILFENKLDPLFAILALFNNPLQVAA